MTNHLEAELRRVIQQSLSELTKNFHSLLYLEITGKEKETKQTLCGIKSN